MVNRRCRRIAGDSTNPHQRPGIGSVSGLLVGDSLDPAPDLVVHLLDALGVFPVQPQFSRGVFVAASLAVGLRQLKMRLRILGLESFGGKKRSNRIGAPAQFDQCPAERDPGVGERGVELGCALEARKRRGAVAGLAVQLAQDEFAAGVLWIDP